MTTVRGVPRHGLRFAGLRAGAGGPGSLIASLRFGPLQGVVPAGGGCPCGFEEAAVAVIQVALDPRLRRDELEGRMAGQQSPAGDDQR